MRWRHFPPLMPICILGHQRRPLCARYLGGVSLAGFPSLHLFATRYVRWRHFPPLMPILYSRTSEETTLRPLFGRGFIGGFSFPPLFATRYVRWRHMTLRRETTTTGLESFPSLCARYMGGVFYPGFPSCGRAGPGVEPGTFGLEIRCSTTEPFRSPSSCCYFVFA